MSFILPRLIVTLLLGSIMAKMEAQNGLPVNPFNQAQNEAAAEKKVVAGTPSIDIVRIDAMIPSVPLRHGGIVEGSETIFLGGELLNRGSDYQLDYSAGVVFIMRAYKPGTSLRATYRFIPNYQPPSQQFAGLGAFRYNLVPGAMGLNLGMGITERGANGAVTSSNVFGFNNGFKFGQGGLLSGAFVVGQRKQVDARSGFDAAPPSAAPKTEESQAIVQALSAKIGSGTFEADYQDISSNFSHFGALQDSGIAAERVNQLQKEKGLTRLGFSFKSIGLGFGSASQSYREVGDGDSKITWQSLGFSQNGFSAIWESQKVDAKFKRFNDLGEQDRAQLAKEAGMAREKLMTEYKAKFGKVSYQQSSIEEASGQAIRRNEFALDTGKIKFNLGEQEIDKGFNRFNSLFEAEKGQWAREKGMQRNWMALDANVFGGTTKPLSFSQSVIKNDGGEYSTTSVAMGGKTWSLGHTKMGTEGSFNALGSLSQGEVDAEIKKISEMYQPGGFNTKPEERSWFTRGEGITREATSLELTPGKDWKIAFNQLNLTGKQGGGWLQTVGIANSRMKFDVRKQNLGNKFAEIGNLMGFERERLGTLAGLDRTDLAFNYKAGGQKTLDLQTTDLNLDGSGGLSRTKLAYTDKGVEISYAKRSVDDTFGASRQLIDSERDLLATLQGFNEEDYTVKWQLLPNLSMNLFNFSASEMGGDEMRNVRNILLNYKFDKRTELTYLSNKTVHSDSATDLFRAEVERLTLARDLGRYGNIRYMKETQDFLNAGLVGFNKEYLAYETKVNKVTDVRTEQTRTSFDDGTREKISANSVSTALNPRTGITVADINIDRHGDERDEHKRNAGFWWDLGNGIRISYGYNRQLVGSTGTTQENLSLASSPGAGTPRLGNLNINSATYAANEWDNTRVQATSSIQLASAKPFDFGPIKQAKFAFGFDAASDRTAWLKENRLLKFEGKWGANDMSLAYVSQIHNSGYRAIDRSFGFATDQNEKKWLRASIFVKERSLPAINEDVHIQNISVTAKPAKNLELSHQLIQNPEVVKGDALLGSVTQAARSEKWKLDFKQSANLTIGGAYEELTNEQSNSMTRAAGLNVTLNEKSGSPIQLYYGLEESDRNGSRKTAHRYHLQFDQSPGPNQMLSFFLGNVSYEHSFENGGRDNWTMRLDYQLRF